MVILVRPALHFSLCAEHTAIWTKDPRTTNKMQENGYEFNIISFYARITKANKNDFDYKISNFKLKHEIRRIEALHWLEHCHK